MSNQVLLLNGPNLNMLGLRQPEIYGHATLADVEASCAKLADELGLGLDSLQSNWEGQLVDWVQDARKTHAGIIINPGAYSHTSIALMDALNVFEGPVVEVHVSNIHAREDFRHFSYVSQRAQSVIAGCGVYGYELGLRQMAKLLEG